MKTPIATYRIQFNRDFQFKDAEKIVQYLSALSISDLYASPIFKATSGSSHGYDVVDPTQINPELGTTEDFDQLVQKLQHHQMGWLQDIVPNHMAYSSKNRYLMDVLENGADSNYFSFFDIAWNSPFASSDAPILTPLLGELYGTCLDQGNIQLQYEESGLSVNYYSLKLPLRLESYATFLTQNLGKLARSLGRRHPDFVKLLGILFMIKSLSSETERLLRRDQTEFVKFLLWELYTQNPDVKEFIDHNIEVFNGEPGQPESFNLLHQILSDQFFRLSYWKVGAEEINYRRFFTVNELISVKVEELKVFNSTHDLIFKLIQDGKFTGLRIDHIDGLANPTQYLERLREKAEDTYITVEKILQPGEDLPQNWQVQGTSGYDFLNYLNGIFCKTENEEAFNYIYQEVIRFQASFEKVFLEKKHLIIDKNLAGDIDNLAALLKQVASQYRYGSDFTINGLKRAIAEVLTRFPIYRTYITEAGVSDSDRAYIRSVLQSARENAPFLQNELNFIEKLLLLDYESTLTQTEKEQWLYFVMRLQQYSGPLMAKGVEDTAFYVYNRLLSLNEVGGNPEKFGVPLEEFHQFNQERQQHWNAAMSATATHDTKRGEDVRARLNVLSEIPEQWQEQVQKWMGLNRQFKQKTKNLIMPDANDEYAFYQTLIGAFPFSETEREEFVDRVQAYVTKSIREAKVYTAWLRPNEAYESACTQFMQAILNPDHSFLDEFIPFQQRIAEYGIFNSLSQTLLKIASPGIPDFYQGTELWDLSMVDPDNRRPVNFEQRAAYLQSFQADPSDIIPDLLKTKEDGRIKLFLTTQALKARAKYHNAFLNGKYQPLEVRGQHQSHVIAFARTHEDVTLLAIAPRFLTSLVQPGELPLGEAVWADTQIQLPAGSSRTWYNAITHQTIETRDQLAIAQALQDFPVALLVHHS